VRIYRLFYKGHATRFVVHTDGRTAKTGSDKKQQKGAYGKPMSINFSNNGSTLSA
jgi:hypothetical protein